MIAVIIICEIISTLFCVWAVTHIRELKKFEDKLKKAIKRDIRTVKISLCVNCLEKEGFEVTKGGEAIADRNN